MILRAMDSLVLTEAVMLIEEVFGTDISDGNAQNFESPSEIVDWLEPHLSNRRPNKQAATFLRKLAKTHKSPELAESLDGTWRREQIESIVREFFEG